MINFSSEILRQPRIIIIICTPKQCHICFWHFLTSPYYYQPFRLVRQSYEIVNVQIVSRHSRYLGIKPWNNWMAKMLYLKVNTSINEAFPIDLFRYSANSQDLVWWELFWSAEARHLIGFYLFSAAVNFEVGLILILTLLFPKLNPN